MDHRSLPSNMSLLSGNVSAISISGNYCLLVSLRNPRPEILNARGRKVLRGYIFQAVSRVSPSHFSSQEVLFKIILRPQLVSF